MYNDGINNQFEGAHQTGLRRGFDLGWSYKGRFDRAIIYDLVRDIPDDENQMVDKKEFVNEIIQHMKNHENNQEFITDC